MTHPRTLIREHMARELVRRGAWADSVFVSRSTPFSDEDHFPNVCVYTDGERTRNALGQQLLEQELALLIEVRIARTPDAHQPWRHVDGLPSHPAQTTAADRELDECCEAIESIVFGQFSNTSVVVEGQKITIDEISEVNTEIARSSEGEVPYVLAQIEFKLVYRACYPVPNVNTCPLEKVLGELRHRVCGVEGQGIHANAYTPQPPQGAC
ncbi:hypothetical protein FHT32_001269 [Variovorax sp. SG517]|uniref:hypothetical protein n=1 Tax=Variovorax sp. SG517 TaxID=2587117 RepID=UPI00159DB757|nr:hypothetical protein [Variovorax sp. SG517]NVM87630.1 hypothetical protein [Variovorax sp. SG517]